MLINNKHACLILAFIICSLLLASCANNTYTVKGKRKQPTDERAVGKIAYTVNIATNSYHLSSCHIATDIKEENKLITYDIDFLCERGFVPCKICIDLD
ncbi:MAG: hypothetical protein IJ437_04675 [Clostridia bacterium]|nr:hypothetical protein [Clostridia bacterium]